jgi:hypothetical protein
MADALGIQDVSLDIIRDIQRCHGHGQRMDERDMLFWSGLQHILESVEKQKKRTKPLPIRGTISSAIPDHIEKKRGSAY